MNNFTELLLYDVIMQGHKKYWSEFAGKSILLTGASGIVGSYFLAFFRHMSENMEKPPKIYTVIHSDIPESHKDLFEFDGFEVLQGDLTTYQFCKQMPQVDYVVHAAGYGQPSKFSQDPIKTLKLNTSTTFALAERLHRGGKMLFVSTSEVYSGLSNTPFREEQIGTTNTDHPRAPYIEAKRTGEAICHSYRSRGIDCKSARLALAYGPGTRTGDGRVMNEFIQKALAGELEIKDSGRAFRTYCYASDAVEAMINILLNGLLPVYNVGGKSRVTIAQLALMIGKIVNVPVSIPEKTSAEQGAPDDVYLDLSRIEKEFQKNSYVDLETGLRRTIDWQRLLYAT